jgi:hypothetical protein
VNIPLLLATAGIGVSSLILVGVILVGPHIQKDRAPAGEEPARDEPDTGTVGTSRYFH